MRRIPWRLLVALFLAAMAAAPAPAQRRARARGGAGFVMPPLSVGPLLGYDFDVDHLFLGGVFNIPF